MSTQTVVAGDFPLSSNSTGNWNAASGVDNCYINTYPFWDHPWNPSTTTTVGWSYPQTDEVAELKAWLDGFMTKRNLTERNLKIIQDKLSEFIGHEVP